MPSLSARADIAVRVCVCSAAASLFAESVWPTGHADPAHVAPLAGSIGSALMLSLLFVCVWDPLKECIARRVLTPRHPHGELVGMPALTLVVVLGAGLVWVHSVLHHHFETQFGASVGAGLERGLIVVFVCAFWFSSPQAVWLRIALAVLLIATIASIGQMLLLAGITQEEWTASEIVWTSVICALLLLAERCFRPWQQASSRRAAWIVAGTGVAVIVLVAIVHLLDRVLPLPSLLLYSSTIDDPHDWVGTMLENLFFYGGWAGGLLIAPDISGES